MVACVVAVILTSNVDRLCGPSRESWGVRWHAALHWADLIMNLLASSCATTDPGEYAVWQRIALCRRKCLFALLVVVIVKKVQCSNISSTLYNGTISTVTRH